MNLFYHPHIILGQTIELEQGEAQHITKAFRKRSGEFIQLTDGQGKLYDASLEIHGHSVQAHVENLREHQHANHRLEIAISPTKNNERLEWFVEKAVEIGIGKISLITCDHSERVHLKHERLLRVAIAAMKQSLKLYLPSISPLQSMEEWMETTDAQIRCIAHCDDRSKKRLQDELQADKSTCIAIGPEGDFSKEEINRAEQKGFVGVSLGASRLRTETAALVAVHTFELINQKK